MAVYLLRAVHAVRVDEQHRRNDGEDVERVVERVPEHALPDQNSIRVVGSVLDFFRRLPLGGRQIAVRARFLQAASRKQNDFGTHFFDLSADFGNYGDEFGQQRQAADQERARLQTTKINERLESAIGVYLIRIGTYVDGGVAQTSRRLHRDQIHHESSAKRIRMDARKTFVNRKQR